MVFYHAPCLDGAAAAWAAYKSPKWGKKATYIGINNNSVEKTREFILSHINTQTHVMFADYTPQRELMDEIAAHAKDVVIYDHHASAMRDMHGYKHKKVSFVSDKRRCGCGLAYDELHPGKKGQRPQVIELVEDIDLERISDDPEEQERFFSIAAYIDSLPISSLEQIIKTFNTINAMSEDEMAREGEGIRRYLTPILQQKMASLAYTKIALLPGMDPVWVPIINADPRGLGREFSMRMRKLAEKAVGAFTALSWYEDSGIVRVSIRTSGVPDAGEVGKYIGRKEMEGLGGGGHDNSAGAQFNIDDFHHKFKRAVRKSAGRKRRAGGPKRRKPKTKA